eukprot:2913660-Ditylum_brightwellii.AAC.1
MEKELLSIVMVCKEFRSILLGSKLFIYTDHKNLTFKNLNSQRVIRWRCFIEEYDPTFYYLPGKENVLADAFSRLPSKEPAEGKKQHIVEPIQDFSFQDRHQIEAFYSPIDDNELFDCLLALPAIQQLQIPITYEWIQQHQFEDEELN